MTSRNIVNIYVSPNGYETSTKWNLTVTKYQINLPLIHSV